MIYFVAGAEFCWETAAVVETYARAALLTAYKFVMGKRKATHSTSNFLYLIRRLEDRPVIVDSGMFTIQGQVWPAGGWQHAPELGQYKSSAWMRWYIDRYVRLLDKAKFNGLVIECDCHLLTRSWEKDLEYARSVLKSAFGDRVIHVWHPSVDGRLAEMTARFNRVAVSDPAMKSATRHSDIVIAKAIREARVRDDQQVHVLGTTNFSYAQFPDNFSCDASTWSMIVRFGRAFPRTLFPVEWYRRRELRAPKRVLEEVDAKFDQCLRAAARTPMNTRKASKPEYLRALAAALVAGNRLFDSISSRYSHPTNHTITGACPLWLTQGSGTREAGRPSTSIRSARGTTSADSPRSGGRRRRSAKSASAA